MVWSAAAWGVAVTGTAQYSVEILNGQRRSIRRALHPAAITQEEAHELLRQTIIRTRCRLDEDWFLDQQGVVPERQIIRRVALSPREELWVQRRGAELDQPGPTDVFDSTGVYLGSLPSETPFPVVFSRDGSFVMLDQDSLGIQSVVAYQVERQ